MNYLTIDSTLSEWANDHGLHLVRTYREAEVRSVDVVGPDGSRSQIWVDPPDGDGKVGVHAWDYDNRRKDVSTAAVDLRRELDRMYSLACTWVGRTP